MRKKVAFFLLFNKTFSVNNQWHDAGSNCTFTEMFLARNYFFLEKKSHHHVDIVLYVPVG